MVANLGCKVVENWTKAGWDLYRVKGAVYHLRAEAEDPEVVAKLEKLESTLNLAWDLATEIDEIINEQ